jgi:hypothetical protein
MAASIFGEKAVLPNEEALRAALKDTQVLWDKILDISGGKGEWKFYGKAAGWTFQVKKGKRTLFYMMPKEGWFQMTFVYGERAVEAAQAYELPKNVLDDLLQAKAYVEGRSVAIKITSNKDIDVVEKMLQLKTEY